MYCEQCGHEYYDVRAGRVACGQCGGTLMNLPREQDVSTLAAV